MSDLISRKDAIDAVMTLPDADNGYSDAYDKSTIIGALEEVPSAGADMSSFCDRLWKKAYDRGFEDGRKSEWTAVAKMEEQE